MTDTTRRQFLKSAVKGAGTTLLTAGVVSLQKPQQRSIKTKVETVKKVEKAGSKVKTYKKLFESTTKRGIYEAIKKKLKTFKPRSGFGGPRPRKVGIGNQDPSRVSGYHY